MMNADYYREQANRARRLAHELANRPDIGRDLERIAQDYDDIVTDP